MNSKAVWMWIWRKKVMLLVAVLAVYCAVGIASNWNNAYQVRISYIYPGAEDGRYPDGQRLMRDDLIATSCIEEALQAMQEKGWYKDITVKQIQDNLKVREYLSNPVQEKVESLLQEGREYTYYNNEFILTFTQPTVLHLKDASDFFGLFRKDRSEEFVNELIRSAIGNFLEYHTEGNVFSDFASYMEVGNADYGDFVDAYTDKATLCINYLNRKKAENSTFVSSQSGMSFDDLVTGYQSLIDVQIGRLLKYASSERITRSLPEMINILEVEIEDLRLTENKKNDEKNIAQTAMLEYDHTFSENIVVVSVNEENGLYQARPKTAYDTVTQQSLDAGVAATTAGNTANNNAQLIEQYTASMGEDQNVEAKQDTAAKMMEQIQREYERLSQLSIATITDYVNITNNNYMETAPVEEEGLQTGELIKAGIGVVLVLALVVSLILDRKGKMVRETQFAGKEV